jgi:hypothetical protein
MPIIDARIHLPWLSTADLELIMGRAYADWHNWCPPTASPPAAVRGGQ